MNIPNIDLSYLGGSIKTAKTSITLEALKIQCAGDEVLELCFEDFLEVSLRYTETICKFHQIVARTADLAQDDVLGEIDRIRGTIHDSLIVSTNVLSRTMGKRGKDNSWFDHVGSDRASIGRFALILSFEFLMGLRKEES